ncbi:MAG TPA: D-TA family PLP-dependent enzyme [Gemmatimonadales bacterium]|jgi:D-serine deaminase-like pyridoxal phosphate-dependent protein|nr:D-TA family PLP-dependent enzyme [Gemmatimonadales bacterium]
MDETPIPLVDLDRLERNLDRMAAYAAQHGLALRPHTKTHKSPRIATEQIRRGAVGLTCATLLETEVMAEASDDLLLAYPPVGSSKLQRLLSLPRETDVTVALDSPEVAEQLAQAARERGRPVGVLVEIDLGMRRVGLTTMDDMVALAGLVASRSPLVYRGIAFYPGHIRDRVGNQTQELERLSAGVRAAVEALDRAGLAPGIVSGGSTPTVWKSHEIEGVTEIRPGTYAYNDRITAQLGACGCDDCALTILATVVSTAVPGQAVIDAGSKALGREPSEGEGEGYGALLDRPEVIVRRLSEEHGILDLRGSDWRPAVGDQVRVVPNHACIAVHLHEVIYGIRGGRLETSWPVTARGRRPLRSSVGV